MNMINNRQKTPLWRVKFRSVVLRILAGVVNVSVIVVWLRFVLMVFGITVSIPLILQYYLLNVIFIYLLLRFYWQKHVFVKVGNIDEKHIEVIAVGSVKRNPRQIPWSDVQKIKIYTNEKSNTLILRVKWWKLSCQKLLINDHESIERLLNNSVTSIGEKKSEIRKKRFCLADNPIFEVLIAVMLVTIILEAISNGLVFARPLLLFALIVLFACLWNTLFMDGWEKPSRSVYFEAIAANNFLLFVIGVSLFCVFTMN